MMISPRKKGYRLTILLKHHEKAKEVPILSIDHGSSITWLTSRVSNITDNHDLTHVPEALTYFTYEMGQDSLDNDMQ